MNKRIQLLTAATAIAGTGSVWAGELGHYGPGLANIRDFAIPSPDSMASSTTISTIRTP